MTHIIRWIRRATRLRALSCYGLACAVLACNSADQLTSTSETEPTAVPVEPSFSGSFRGGIPFGTWALPNSHFGEVYNGAMRSIWAKHLLQQLAEIKSRGGKVILSLVGKETHYLDNNHEFSLTLWKRRLEPFRDIDFSSYIDDGTIIGHYLIDEPNDPANWGGKPVPGSMVEQMAAYSKQLWPTMPTIVRAEPRYLAKTGGPYRDLDAAWAQYVTWKGTPQDYITRNVADARQLGLALVTGLNIRKGNPERREMSGSLMETAGSTLLRNDYPCAFISWEYDGPLLARSEVESAMRVLSRMAESRPSRSCRRAGGDSPPPPPDDDGDDDDGDSDGEGDGDGGGGGDDGDGDDGDGEVPSVNRTPVATFASVNCRAGSPCSFTDASSDSDGSIASRAWDFGDGTSSSEANPSVTYTRQGRYNVSLQVTDNQGATATFTRRINVRRGTLPGSTTIVLNLENYRRNNRQYVDLSWSGADGRMVDVYRNGVLRQSTRNDRKYIRHFAIGWRRVHTYQLCETGSTRCSNSVTVTLE